MLLSQFLTTTKFFFQLKNLNLIWFRRITNHPNYAMSSMTYSRIDLNFYWILEPTFLCQILSQIGMINILSFRIKLGDLFYHKICWQFYSSKWFFLALDLLRTLYSWTYRWLWIFLIARFWYRKLEIFQFKCLVLFGFGPSKKWADSVFPEWREIELKRSSRFMSLEIGTAHTEDIELKSGRSLGTKQATSKLEVMQWRANVNQRSQLYNEFNCSWRKLI